MVNIKNIVKKIYFSFLVLILASGVLSGCSNESINSTDDIISEKANEYINTFNDVCTENRYMGSVLIEKEGEIVFYNSYGIADLENNISNENDTIFRIGSISKSITATAIFQLHEKGLINIDDNISKYIPIDGEESNITIKNLLNHTSGLARDSYLDYEKVNSNEKISLAIENEPGIECCYSNYGYNLLACIIENVSEMSYPDYLKENIFDPLNMSSTGCGKSNEEISNIASAYKLNQGEIKLGTYIDANQFIGSGNIYSTTSDLSNFFNALSQGELIKKENLDMMITDNTGLNSDYGYGFELGEYSGHKWYGHSGALPCGYRSMSVVFPEDDITVVLLLNVYFSSSIYDMVTPLAAIAFGEEYTMPVSGNEIKLTGEELEKYEGDYKIPNSNDIIKLTIKNNYLELTPSTNKAVLIPYSESEFTIRGFEYYKLVFSFDENENVSGFILKNSIENTLQTEKAN